MKEESPYTYIIEMWSSMKIVRFECRNVDGRNAQIQFSYVTCLECINRFGIEEFLEHHKEMISNLIK